MNRCAIFIDAGYLLAEAGEFCFNTLKKTGKKNRPVCDYKQMLEALKKLACNDCGLPILRTYWYDAAPNAIGLPAPEQDFIASLPNVKIRLGRIIGGKQKGVDSLIYRDIMTLARERAFEIGYLLSGDEDLREGVIAAQEMGVQMVLIGVPSKKENNQSPFLIREADKHIMVEESILRPYLKEPLSSRPIPTLSSVSKEPIAIGRRFARRWLKDAKSEEISELEQQLQNNKGRIPPLIDAELLRFAKNIKESETEEFKRHLREGFRQGIARSGH